MAFYQNGEITVDESIARFGSKAYAIDKINSMDMRVDAPHGILPVIVWSLIALVGLGMLAAPESRIAGVIVAGLFGFLAYQANRKRWLRRYRLYLTTSSSENQAFETSDGEQAMALREAIERAMAAR